jgi:TfoX/Sxy family transcriptional regulator of competence genes
MKRRRNRARHLARTPFPDFTSFNPGYKLALPGTIALQRREKVSMAYDEETAARVRKVLSGRRDVVEKKMMGGLSFMVDGAMFCSVSGRGGLLVRVGAEAQERVLREPHVQPVGMGKRMVTGFVRVAPEGYRTDAALTKWVERGIAFVAANPPAARAKQKRPAPKRAAGQSKSAKRRTANRLER